MMYWWHLNELSFEYIICLFLFLIKMFSLFLSVFLTAFKGIYHLIAPQLFTTWDFELIRTFNITDKLLLILKPPLWDKAQAKHKWWDAAIRHPKPDVFRDLMNKINLCDKWYTRCFEG